MSESFDLLGDPIPDGWGRRGRPQHIATSENRNKVMLLLAAGWNNERIARALSITPPTLRKNYFRELRYRQEARDRVEGNLMHRLWQLAVDGNVAAAKEFRKTMERNDLMGGHPEVHHSHVNDRSVTPPKLGKKEQALVDAREPDRGSTLGELMAQRQAPDRSVN